MDLAPSAEIALAYLEQHSYDAITLDLKLPDQSGINLIRMIRSQARTETLATKTCDAQAAEKKLSGAEKTSFTKKCVTDATAAAK